MHSHDQWVVPGRILARTDRQQPGGPLAQWGRFALRGTRTRSGVDAPDTSVRKGAVDAILAYVDTAEAFVTSGVAVLALALGAAGYAVWLRTGQPKRLNVVILTVESFRADFVRPDVTPNLLARYS